MAKEEIVNGIKLALDKGQTLRDAMVSFFNAGYSREEINDAAREVLNMTDSSGNKIYSNKSNVPQSSNVPPAPAAQTTPKPQPSQNVPAPTPQTTPKPQSPQSTPTPAPQTQNVYPVSPQPQRSTFQQQPQFQPQPQPQFQQQNLGHQHPQNRFGTTYQGPPQQNFQGPANVQQGYPQTPQGFQTPAQVVQPHQPQQFQQPPQPQQSSQPVVASQEKKEQSAKTSPSPTVQKVSNYTSEKKKSKGKTILLFILFFFLLLITGGIFGLVFYKESIFSFFGI